MSTGANLKRRFFKALLDCATAAEVAQEIQSFLPEIQARPESEKKVLREMAETRKKQLSGGNQ